MYHFDYARIFVEDGNVIIQETDEEEESTHIDINFEIKEGVLYLKADEVQFFEFWEEDDKKFFGNDRLQKLNEWLQEKNIDMKFFNKRYFDMVERKTLIRRQPYLEILGYGHRFRTTKIKPAYLKTSMFTVKRGIFDPKTEPELEELLDCLY